MKCPFCEHEESRVLDSRETDDNTTIRRRRECVGCLRRFTTYERYEETPLVVVKKDMRREKFERGKMIAGINKACEKRPVSSGQKEAIVNSVERELRHRGEAEISSVEIGELVMRYLKGLDQVAYVRFASVYKDFQDVSKFAEELQNLEAARIPSQPLPARPKSPVLEADADTESPIGRSPDTSVPNESELKKRRRRS